MADLEKVPWSESAFKAFFSPDLAKKQALADGLAALRAASGSNRAPEDQLMSWTVKGPVNEVDRGWRRA
jgi:hypothetical protein